MEIFKYCPRCGSEEFVAIEWRAKKCNRCSFTYYMNASAAVAAIIFDSRGRLLLTRRAVEPHKGMLDLPGGFANPGETAEEAICREINEELGIVIKDSEYFCSFPNLYPFSGFDVPTLDLAFKVTVDIPEEMQAMDDISAFEFHYPVEIDMNEISAESIRNIIKKLVDDERNNKTQD